MNHNEVIDVLMQAYSDNQSLHNHFSNSELQGLSEHDSEDIRIWLAKALVNHDGDDDVKFLVSLSRDKDPLVRLEVADSLSTYVNRDSFSTLLALMNDSDDLVRAYAAFGVALVGRTIAQQTAQQTLLNVASVETNKRVLVDVYEGLYLLGLEAYLQKLFGLFESKDYHTQIAVLHALEEIANDENNQAIAQFVWNLETTNRVRSVAEAIKQVRATFYVSGS